MIKILIAFSLRGKGLQGLHEFFRCNSINEELIFIALLIVILTIVLLCEYRQKRLEKKR